MNDTHSTPPPDDKPSDLPSNRRAAKQRVRTLNDIRPVRDYLARIGAVPRSLFTAVIETQEGRYKKAWVVIKLTRDGAVSLRPTSRRMNRKRRQSRPRAPR